jgi:integrating conjugative element membrane protein (TIGR03745 family)
MSNKRLGSITGRLAVVYLFFMALPLKVMAALPAAATVADGASTTSPLQWLRDMGVRGVTIGATIIAGLVVMGVAAAIYTSFKESRERDQWGKFGVTSLAGVVVIATAVVFSILAVQYATP